MNVTTGSFGAPAVSDGAPNFSRPLYSSLKYSSSFANPSGVSAAFSSSYGGASVSHQTRGLYGSSLRPSSVTYTAKLSNTSVGDVAPFSKFSGISGVAPVYSSTSFSKSLLPSTFRTSSFSSRSVANRVPPSANPPSNQGTYRYHLLEMYFNAHMSDFQVGTSSRIQTLLAKQLLAKKQLQLAATASKLKQQQ